MYHLYNNIVLCGVEEMMYDPDHYFRIGNAKYKIIIIIMIIIIIINIIILRYYDCSTINFSNVSLFCSFRHTLKGFQSKYS